ncbi:MAG: hypothetical protein LBO20_05515, partial [Bifidobacteriaceae bacterium]|nr:hypothetical protein [Bifidobacteriaceae bacterium]
MVIPTLEGKTGRLAAIPVVVLLALGLASCGKVAAEFDVNADNTVEESFVLAASEDWLEQTAGTKGVSYDAALAEFRDLVEESIEQEAFGAGGDGSYTDFKERGFAGVRWTARNPVSLDEFNLGDGEGENESTYITVTRVGDDFQVEGAVDLSFPEMSEGVTSVGGSPDELSVEIRMTFPGKVKSGSGRIDGRSITFSPELGEVTELKAVASAKPMVNLLLMAAGGVTLLLVVVVVVLALA